MQNLLAALKTERPIYPIQNIFAFYKYQIPLKMGPSCIYGSSLLGDWVVGWLVGRVVGQLVGWVAG